MLEVFLSFLLPTTWAEILKRPLIYVGVQISVCHIFTKMISIPLMYQEMFTKLTSIVNGVETLLVTHWLLSDQKTAMDIFPQFFTAWKTFRKVLFLAASFFLFFFFFFFLFFMFVCALSLERLFTQGGGVDWLEPC